MSVIMLHVVHWLMEVLIQTEMSTNCHNLSAYCLLALELARSHFVDSNVIKEKEREFLRALMKNVSQKWKKSLRFINWHKSVTLYIEVIKQMGAKTFCKEYPLLLLSTILPKADEECRHGFFPAQDRENMVRLCADIMLNDREPLSTYKFPGRITIHL